MLGGDDSMEMEANFIHLERGYLYAKGCYEGNEIGIRASVPGVEAS